MRHRKTPWSHEEWSHCLECFARSNSIEEACKKFAEKYPTRTSTMVRLKFQHEGLGGMTQYLKTAFDPKKHLQAISDTEKARIIEKAEKEGLEVLRKKQTMIEMIIDSVRAEVEALPAPAKVGPAILKDKGRMHEEIVAPISDVQIGEFVAPESLAGLGEYSFNTFKERVDKWKRHLVTLVKRRQKDFNIDKLHIPFVGDIVEGVEIFPSQPFHIEMGLVKQAVRGSFIFSQAIAEIAATFPNLPIEIEHVGGNHGRIGRKGAVPYADNWDRVLGFFTELQLAEYSKQVKITVPDEWFVLKTIKGWNFHLSHGDNIAGWMGIPAYGMLRAHSRATIMHRTSIDYFLIGHHHNLTTLQNGYGEVICNGNWVGSNEFSAKELQLMNRPCQIMFSVNEDYGISERSICYFESMKSIRDRVENMMNRSRDKSIKDE